MTGKKFEYVKDDTKEVEIDGKYALLTRIKAIKEFILKDGIVVRKGELGGYITPHALSQMDRCWVDENSCAISNNFRTIVFGDATIYGSTIINASVSDEATVSSSFIKGDDFCYVEISGKAQIVKSAVYNAGLKLSGEAKLNRCEILSNKSKFGITGSVNIFGSSVLKDCKILAQPGEVTTILLAGQYNNTIEGQVITETLINKIPRNNKKTRQL